MTIMSYLHIIRIDKKILTIPNTWKYAEQTDLSTITEENTNWDSHCREQFGSCLNVHLLYDSVTSLSSNPEK